MSKVRGGFFLKTSRRGLRWLRSPYKAVDQGGPSLREDCDDATSWPHRALNRVRGKKKAHSGHKMGSPIAQSLPAACSVSSKGDWILVGVEQKQVFGTVLGGGWPTVVTRMGRLSRGSTGPAVLMSWIHDAMPDTGRTVQCGLLRLDS